MRNALLTVFFGLTLAVVAWAQVKNYAYSPPADPLQEDAEIIIRYKCARTDGGVNCAPAASTFEIRASFCAREPKGRGECPKTTFNVPGVSGPHRALFGGAHTTWLALWGAQ